MNGRTDIADRKEGSYLVAETGIVHQTAFHSVRTTKKPPGEVAETGITLYKKPLRQRGGFVFEESV